MTLVVNTPCSYLWCWLGTLLPNFANNIGNYVYVDTIDNLFGNKLNANECSGHITTQLTKNVNSLSASSVSSIITSL